MNSGEIATPAHLSQKVLAAASAHGHRVELLENQDGSLLITRDGAQEAIYQKGASLETYIKTYMRILRFGT